MALGALPDYPWDLMAPYRERAAAHADGLVDLSIGSPVDPTPDVVREALARATDAHAYPQTTGTPALRAAIVEWFARRRGVTGLDAASVLPTIGSKELVALLPFMLGLGEGDVVVHPRAAYPTYEIGALFAGARALASDDPGEWPAETRLVWLNTPGQPRRPGALRRGAPCRAHPRTRARRRDRERRVLRRAGLGRRMGRRARAEPARPAGDRWRPPPRARHLLALEAVEHGRVSRRVHRRMPRVDRPADERAQARGAHAARTAPGGDGGRPRRRAPRRRAEGALPRAPRPAPPGARGGRLPHRPQRGRTVPVGHRGARRVGLHRAARRPRHPRRPGPLLRGALPRPRAALAHGHRRADRRRRRAPQRLRGGPDAAILWRPPTEGPMSWWMQQCARSTSRLYSGLGRFGPGPESR